MSTFNDLWRKLREVLALAFLFLIYHVYEALCYILSNLHAYYVAAPMFAAALFLGSMGLIVLHDFLKNRFGWDALALQYINSLREDQSMPPYDLGKRLARFVLQKGFWAIFVFGPIILGPFIITLLLRHHKSWKVHVIYAACGSLFNALFWVAFMKALGVLTWPYIHGIF
jgi:hypothetical protein